MDFKLLELEIYGRDKKSHIKFTIETEEVTINYDKALRFDNKDDTDLMKSLEAFINTKVVK